LKSAAATIIAQRISLAKEAKVEETKTFGKQECRDT